jgi:hypothetical protein
MKFEGTIMKRPASLTVVAVLLFLIGLSGIVADCIQTHGLALAPSVNLFNMIAGVGLLKLWRGARQYALFVTWPVFVMVLPFTVWAIFNPERISIHLPSILIVDHPHAIHSLFAIIPEMVGFAALSGWMLWVLHRHDVRELFQHKTNSPVPTI